MAPDRQKVIQTAEKLVVKGRIQAAIDQYRKVLDRQPNDTSTLNRVGDLYVRINRMPKAIELFQQTAESFGRQGFFVKAIAIYKKIIRLDPSQIAAYEALAGLYNRQGLTGDALAQYQVVADYYRKHDNPDAAIGIYHSMVEIEPNNPTRRLQLAGLLQGEGQTSRALDQYFEIARLMLEHSRGDDALRVLTEGMAVDPENLDFVRKAMHALQDGGFDRLASSLLDTAIEKNPQANALRLEELPAKSEAAAATQAPAREAPVQEEPAQEEPAQEELAQEEPAQEPPVQEERSPEHPAGPVEEPETIVELDLGEVDLGDLEELPPVESLDPVLPAAAGATAAPAPTGEVAPPVRREGDGASAVDEEAEFTLEDVAALADASEADDQPAAAALDAGESLGFELDLEEPVETIASQPAEATEPELAEPKLEVTGESIKLLIEAEVLSRYGMHEMAVSVLERIVRAEPRHTEAMARLAQSQLEAGHADEALTVANQLASLVEVEGAPQGWDALCASMAGSGSPLVDGRFGGQTVVATPEPVQAEPVQAEPVQEEPVKAEPEVSAPVESAPEIEVEGEAAPEQSLEELVAGAAAEVAPRARLGAEPEEDVLGEVIEEIEREAGELTAAEEDTDATSKAAAEEAELEKAGVEAESEIEARTAGAVELPVELASDEFVDLATELEAELGEEDGLEDDLLPNLREQSLEDIVEGFRQGMAETLSDSDFDTHYNLGVAYQEMGLIDEAIGEFQLAAKDDRYLVDCSSFLASCFVEKNLPDLAIQWFVRGIDSPAVDPESKLGLLYELASLLVTVGEPEAARARLLEIYGVEANYRDVAAKLEELPA